MPAPSTPVRLYNIQAPQSNEVYGSVFDQAQADAQNFFSNDGIKQRIALVVPAPQNAPGNRLFDYVDPTGATVELAVGAINSQVTGGTYQLSYNSSTTGLTALAFDISAANLQTALNANAAVTSGGNTVTVTLQSTGVYRVAFDQVGVRFLFACDGANLTPTGTVTASRVVTGSASVKEVQIIRLLQRPYAYNATWSAFPVAAAAVTNLQTGTSLLPSIQRVSLDPEPYDGSFVVNCGTAEVVRVQAKANSGGVAEVSRVITVADVAGSLSGVYFDLYDNVGPVRVWINVSAGSTQPATPSGGRLLAVAITTNDSASTVGTAVSNAIDADSKFAASVVSATVTITDSNTGTRTDIAAGTSTFSVGVATQGVTSILDDKYFVIYDSANSSVAVWLTLDGTSPPTGVLEQSRYISVTIGATDSASTVGGAIATAVDADADFTASNSSGVVTITGAANGTRTAATAGDSTFGVSVTTMGYSLSPVIQWNSSADSIQQAIDPDKELLVISKSGPFAWDFKFTENGARSAFTTDVTGLKVPVGLIGTLNLATEQMLAACIANNFEPFTATYEGQVTFSGELPWTFYQVTVTVIPDLIDFSTLAPANLPAYATQAGDNTFTGTNAFDEISVTGTATIANLVVEEVAALSAVSVARTATATDYTVLSTDCIIGVTSTAAARVVTLPAAASHARKLFIVKDESGGAGTNNITVKSVSGTLDGVAAATGVAISTNYGVSRWYSNGTNYFSF